MKFQAFHMGNYFDNPVQDIEATTQELATAIVNYRQNWINRASNGRGYEEDIRLVAERVRANNIMLHPKEVEPETGTLKYVVTEIKGCYGPLGTVWDVPPELVEQLSKNPVCFLEEVALPDRAIFGNSMESVPDSATDMPLRVFRSPGAMKFPTDGVAPTVGNNLVVTVDVRGSHSDIGVMGITATIATALEAAFNGQVPITVSEKTMEQIEFMAKDNNVEAMRDFLKQFKITINIVAKP